ncbi:hypothetical protein HYV86_00115 [Candidatus Woesearchaeota archaeon]|nr:hypothetical protein [Candidatus Woesearchaeota archaeon]
MDQRKLIQHGLSSLTVALPSDWIKSHGLTKGNNVYVEKEGGSVIISTKQPIKHEKIKIDITKLDRTSALLYIMSLYRFGYNEIEIHFTKPSTAHYRKEIHVSYPGIVHEITNRLIGAEVVEHSEKSMLIKTLAKESDEDFRIILRRIFLLLIQTSEAFLEGIRKKDLALIEGIELMHDNVNKFVSYALRLLNKYGYPDVKKTCFYYHIIASIDKIMDVFKYNARDIVSQRQRFNPKSIEIFEQIHLSLRLYYELFYSFSLERVNQLSKNRDEVKRLIAKNAKLIPTTDLLLLVNQKSILEILLDLTDFRMGLEQ